MNGTRAALAMAGVAAALAAAAVLWLVRKPSEAPVQPHAVERSLAAPHAFSAEPAMQLAPRFSPDGRHVAFALGDERETRIVVQALDGSSRQFVGAPRALRLSPVFFPDGRRIAFWQAAGGDCAIVEYDLRTGSESRLLDCAMLPRVRFDLSPDGRRLVFTGAAQARSGAGLWALDLASGAIRRLTDPGAGMGDDLHPRFSPDGRLVAFFRGRGAERQPWAVALSDPGSARPLTARSGPGHGLAWAGPRGPLLVASEWDGRAALHLLDPLTGQARLASGDGARFPDVSRAGDVVYERQRAQSPAARPDGLGVAVDVAPGGAAPDGAIDLMVARSKIVRP